MAAIALIALVLTIVIGTVKRINMGIMGLITACILSLIAGIPVKEIAGGFGSLLFLRLVTIQMLICIAQVNGTMKVLSSKIIQIGCRKNIRLFPIVVYVAIVVCTVIGFDVTFLIPPFLIAIAYQLKLDPLMLFFPYSLAFIASAASPLAVSGANLNSVTESAGLAPAGWNVVVVGVLTSCIMFVIFYFYFGWNKQPNAVIEDVTGETFSKEHVLTVLGFIAYVLLTTVFKLDILVVSSIICFMLFLLNAANPQQVIVSLPWNILIMIGGMSVLSNVVVMMGGVQLLSDILATVANPVIVVALFLIIAAAMSFFSSGNGVVIPTLVPVVASLAVGDLSSQATSMVIAVGLGASSTGISPMSTIGGNWISCYDSVFKPSEQDRQKTFNRQLVFVLACMGLQAVFALLGIYRIQLF